MSNNNNNNTNGSSSLSASHSSNDNTNPTTFWRKGGLGGWRKYQFILTPSKTLTYRRCAEENSAKPKEWRTIHLDNCLVKSAESLTHRPFSFALVVGNKKTLLLAAEDEEIKNEWVEQIRANSGHDLGKMNMMHLLEGVNHCLVVSDEKGTILGLNKTAKDAFGYSHSEAVGNNVTLLMPHKYANAHRSYIERHIATGEARVIGTTRRVLGQRKNGELFPLEIRLGKIHADGQVRFVATMTEISTKSNTETLALVDSARSHIIETVGVFTESVETEFEKLRHRIIELEHHKRDSELIIEGLTKKVEYHIQWHEAAEMVLRDNQREEIQKRLSDNEHPKGDSAKADDDGFFEHFREFELFTSLLIYPGMMKEIHSWLPGPIQIKKPTLMYSTSMHGPPLRTFLARSNVSPNLLLIRAAQTNHVFGGYFTHGWVRSQHYYGDGQCFLFTLIPRPRKYTWNPGHPTQFMMVSDSSLVIGGGGKGHALWIDLDAQMATTDASETFDSDPLVPLRDPFKIDVLEVYAFN